MVCEHSDSKEPSRVIRYLRFIWTVFFPTISTTPYIKSSAVVQVLQPVDTTLITLTRHDLGVLKHLYVGFLNRIRFDRTIMTIVWSRDFGSTGFRITNEHCRVAWCQAAPWNPMIFLVVNTKSTVRPLHINKSIIASRNSPMPSMKLENLSLTFLIILGELFPIDLC
jgi:hypothetical protein